ncbi:TadE/TadG family type IV pilus assembly protein [Lichenibacterium ramalinae]|uniref:TadE/TadG family type IV pilus assembly protein n=1 Tax=Lichenibacterium ramalinae TaxID=2316527 RepID=UPI0013ED343A|nr:TadE/TadG family type IV pilus assembly protein [Lichenibacterium ramalinae]
MAAVEFGLLGGMFILLMCFWMEIGLSLFMQAALDRAVRKEARLIRTGTITASGAATFAANLCTDLQVLMSCANIQYNVASASSFAALSAAVPTDGLSRMTTTGFAPGGSGQAVIVQVGYARALFLPIVNAVLGKNGTLLVYASLAFQNEPF